MISGMNKELFGPKGLRVLSPREVALQFVRESEHLKGI